MPRQALTIQLTEPERLDCFRPNFWPNTPDILHADLVRGGRPSYARGWRLLRLPDLPAFHGYRAYVARPAGRQ